MSKEDWKSRKIDERVGVLRFWCVEIYRRARRTGEPQVEHAV